MKYAIMIHGMGTTDRGKGSVGRLRPYLEQYHHEVMMFSYRYLGLIGTRRKNEYYARRLTNKLANLHLRSQDTITLYCHSNGATIAYVAMQMPIARKLKERGVKINLVLINPALNRKLPFPPQINQIRIFHAKDDIVVKFAHFLRQFLSVFDLEVMWRPWGDMGRYGYKGRLDSRVRNIELTDFAKPPLEVGHSGAFSNEHIKHAIACSINKEPVN